MIAARVTQAGDVVAFVLRAASPLGERLCHLGEPARSTCEPTRWVAARVRVAVPGGHHMHGISGREQRGRMQVAQIMYGSRQLLLLSQRARLAILNFRLLASTRR
jgi:hypothetical protein